MDEFLKQIAVILEVENVNASDPLASFTQLDSMGVLSVIAMLDASYGVNISTTDIGRMSTVGELWAHVQCIKRGCA
ncbi:MAG: acyl carrier protein [Verrucomicrobiota bacterium]